VRSNSGRTYIRCVPYSPIPSALGALALAVILASCADSGAIAPQIGAAPSSGPTLPIPADLWRPPAGSTPAVGTYLYVETEPSVAPGVTSPRTLTAAAGRFTIAAGTGALTIAVEDTTNRLDVRGAFTTMLGHVQLEEGYYRDLRGPADADPLKGSLDVTFDARRCAALTGWFVVDHVFYFNGRLTTLDLRFEQRCAGVAVPTHGQLHWTENLT
jgi:hypothetical protein